MNYKLVLLKKINDEYKKLGLHEENPGIVLNENHDKSDVMFCNDFNQGDYLVLTVNNSDLEFTNMFLPENLVADFENFIHRSQNEIFLKTHFKEIPFNECDYVELIVEKEKYAKYGLHKGDRGVVASDKAIKNSVLVDFENASDDFDGFCSIDYKDIIKIK